jgi:site-specific DNA-methyltransferase (adenine-specific)
MEINKIYHGNNLDILRTFPDNSIDSIVTDPPYGLGKEPNALEVLQSWITTGYHEIKGKGFMGKEWDSFVPQPVFWKECLRVLKPGGHLLSFAGTRTYDWVVMGLRIAGFEIRDQIAWVYGSGFPKSLDVSKAIDKSMGAEREVINDITDRREDGTTYGLGHSGKLTSNNGITDEAKQWQGWGTALNQR